MSIKLRETLYSAFCVLSSNYCWRWEWHLLDAWAFEQRTQQIAFKNKQKILINLNIYCYWKCMQRYIIGTEICEENRFIKITWFHGYKRRRKCSTNKKSYRMRQKIMKQLHSTLRSNLITVSYTHLDVYKRQQHYLV